MKNKLIIRRYLPINSFVHHLDPRAKLMFVFLFIILIFFCHSPLTYLWMFALILFFYEISKNSIMVPNQRFNANIFLFNLHINDAYIFN